MNRQLLKMNVSSNKNQLGLSLIELLISMVVGLFLLAGVVTNFISTNKTDLKRVAVTEMDDNAAQALETIRKVVAHAGYPSIENTPMETAFYSTNANIASPKCANNEDRDKYTMKGNRRTRDGGARDFLMVLSLADNPCLPGATSCTGVGNANINPSALVYTDCTGGGGARDAHAVACSTDPDLGIEDSRQARLYSAFWLQRNISSPEDRTLYCDGSRGGRQPIANNVEAIQYLYGVRDDNDRTNYRKANDVEAAGQWAMVTSIQVGLLMRSSNQFVLDKPSTKTRYNVLNQNVNIAVADRRRLFRTYVTTINLENRK